MSAAPAIGEYMAALLAQAGGFIKKDDCAPAQREPTRFRELSDEKRRALIARDSAFGRIICRCETVTEGEVLEAIRGPAGAVDLDGIKRRVRAGAGRCQGGFCGPKVAELLAGELGVPIEQVTKCGGDSRILVGRTGKEGWS